MSEAQSITVLLGSFREMLQARSAGAGTIRSHLEGVDLFARRIQVDVTEWNRHHVRTFLATPGWKTNTRRIRWKALNAFANFLVAEGFHTESFVDGVPCPPAGPARRPPMLTDEDFGLLLGACPAWTWLGLRNRAILWMLWTTPFRKSELAALRVDNLDFLQHGVHTDGSKNGDSYWCTLFPATADAIKAYLDKRPYDHPSLWITDEGEPMSPGTLTLTLRRIEVRARASGFDKHVYPHAFRHHYGMNTVRWGLSTVETARSMGQRSEKAASVYTQWLAVDEAQTKIRRAAGIGV
jgi:integrase